MSRKVPEWSSNVRSHEEMQKQCESRSVTKMEQKLRLCAFMTLLEVSFAVWQRVTAIKGQTVDLTFPVTNADLNAVEWRNPDMHTIYFSSDKKVSSAAVSKRHSLKKRPESKFTLTIADVTFEDAGNYTFYEYSHPVTEKKVELTVIGLPRIIQKKYKGRVDLKCTAQASYPPPQIIWKLDNGPDILAQSQIKCKDKACRSLAVLSLQAVEDNVTVTCLVQHPALYTQCLMDFVQIRQSANELPRITSPKCTPHLSDSSTSSVPPPPSLSTRPTPTASTSADVSVRHNSTASEGILPSSDDELLNATSIEGGPNPQKRRKESSSVLVFLVACLITALLVVVIFFAIKLRRAHIAWKKENEDSDPSEESSKSKSSQEEKKGQGKNSRGLIKTMFTQYVVEEPSTITSVVNTAALNSAHNANNEPTLHPQPTTRTGVTFSTKETDL